MRATAGRVLVAVAVALLAVVAMSAAAGADSPAVRSDSACDGYPLRWTRAKALEYVARDRAELGFRSDEEYLTGRARRVERDRRVTWIVPYTRAERAYLAARERLWRAVQIADAYLRRHARDVSGGVWIEEAWPSPAFVRVRLTRDVERHVAAIRARLNHPEYVHGLQVERSERELEAIVSRVNHDWKDLKAEGLHVLSADADRDDNVVVVSLWTRRADAAQALLKRYGPAVRVEVVADTPTYEACTDVMGYRLARGGRVLRIDWGHSGMVRLARVEVRETARRVTVGVVVRVPHGPITADLRVHTERIRLRRPLKRRVIIDAGDGARVPCRPSRSWDDPARMRERPNTACRSRGAVR